MADAQNNIAQQDRDALIAQLVQSENERRINQFVETNIKIMSAQFDKAVVYTNLVIAGGYGAFFGLWTLGREYLGPVPGRLAVVLMLFSVAVFVFFETYKMIKTARYRQGWRAVLDDPRIGNDFNLIVQTVRDYERAEALNNISFLRIWNIVLLLTIIPALLAVTILTVSLVCGLLGTVKV